MCRFSIHQGREHLSTTYFKCPSLTQPTVLFAGVERIHFVPVNLPCICFGQASARPQGSQFRPHSGILLLGDPHWAPHWRVSDPHSGIVCIPRRSGRKPTVCCFCPGRKFVSQSTAAGKSHICRRCLLQPSQLSPANITFKCCMHAFMACTPQPAN